VIAASILAPFTVCLAAAQAAWLAAGTGGPAITASSLPAGAVPTVAASGRDVTVSWTAATMSSATVGYVVHRYDAVSGTTQTVGSNCANVATSVTCTEATLPAGNWKYAVTPSYASWTGTESTKSATVTTPPPAPTSPSASATSSSGITVSWTAASGATGYQVLRGTSAGGPYALVASPTATSYGDTGLTASTTYYYVVTATFNGAVSARSAEAGATTPAMLVANGDFEGGSLSSWTNAPAPASSGTTAVQTGFDGYTPHAGSYFAVVVPGAADTDAHLSQSFTVAAGQTISGWAFFDGKDYMPYNDAGAVVIQHGGSDVATVFAGSIGTLGDYGTTGWTQWTYTAPSSGTYTVDARVRNGTDGGQDSYLGIDDVVVQ
jgi:hypothetical protein